MQVAKCKAGAMSWASHPASTDKAGPKNEEEEGAVAHKAWVEAKGKPIQDGVAGPGPLAACL